MLVCMPFCASLLHVCMFFNDWDYSTMLTAVLLTFYLLCLIVLFAHLYQYNAI